MIIGSSGKAQDLRNILLRVAKTDAAVCLTGETGSGKEVAAQYIHNYSNRSKGPFIAINCGSFSPNMITSEIFGYEKGAFTGAISSYPGRFEQADNGTLFLDEIGEMPHEAQVTLLRVLETKEVERIGGRSKRKVNVRIICATNRSLEHETTYGSFRKDLFYRLSVFPVKIPSLADRADDIPELADHFLSMIPTDLRPFFSHDAIRCLQEYSWPGNIRELRNIVERTAIMFPKQIVSANSILDMSLVSKDRQQCSINDNKHQETNQHINSEYPSTNISSSIVNLIRSEHFSLRSHIQNLEKMFVNEALSMSSGSVSSAARMLGLQRTTLIEKIRRFEQKAS